MSLPIDEDPTCEACGACCREAFHVVELEEDDPLLLARPDLVVRHDGRLALPRGPDGRCPALSGGAGSYRCALYEDRPWSCRDFERCSDNCHLARRRVGLEG